MTELPIPNHRFKDEETSKRNDFARGGIVGDSHFLDAANYLSNKEFIIPASASGTIRMRGFTIIFPDPIIKIAE